MKYLLPMALLFSATLTAQQNFDNQSLTPQAPQSTATLSQDAYYNGAFIDSEQNVTFYQTGLLAGGLLKENFNQNNLVFKSGSSINFFENGQVKAGTLLEESQTNGNALLANSYVVFWGNGQIRNATMKKDSTPENKNLILPVDMEVQFSSNGHITSVTPFKAENYRLFGKLLKGQAQLLYDETTNQYQLYKGTLAEAEIIASLANGVSAYGNTTKAVAVIAPRNSTFSLYQANSLYAGGQQSYDIYYLPDSLQINNYEFGDNPAIYVRNMQLHAIQVQQDVRLDGYQYQAGQLVLLDQKGKVVSP
ncbi:hypothetical protein [Neptunicella sp. SCSIO 80796]|uniref:hypothetical protein n=1 Tax=Neptunicella plasticusilytica TaxID=3117012 RepID=UPI003A4DC6D5